MIEDSSFLGFAPPDYFFAVDLDCQFYQGQHAQSLSKKYELPELSQLFVEEPFAELFMGWNPAGLFFRFAIRLSEEIQISYPEIQRGDSIELFIDTRDVKTARTSHRFCHHFFFLPESQEGISRGEITRFRTEDSHLLCKREDLELTVTGKAKKGYTAAIFIPKECLVGFDPEECDHIGFTYRVNRSNGSPQCFGLTSDLCTIEHHPYLWNSVHLTNEEKT